MSEQGGDIQGSFTSNQRQ
jgi:hypothetical protein